MWVRASPGAGRTGRLRFGNGSLVPRTSSAEPPVWTLRLDNAGGILECPQLTLYMHGMEAHLLLVHGTSAHLLPAPLSVTELGYGG